MNEPWSKRHKRVFKGCPFSLSNSFAEPLSMSELLQLCQNDQNNNNGDDSNHHHDHHNHDLLAMYKNHSLEYTPNGGSLDLRQAIANLYGPDTTADHILVFPGAQVAIQTAAMVLAQNVTSIVFPPGYQSTIDAPSWAKNSSSVMEIARCEDNNWLIDTNAVQAALEETHSNNDNNEIKMILINEPYNPGGRIMSLQDQNRLIELARKHRVAIVCDEVYRFMEHDSQDRLPAMVDSYEQGLSITTLSKAWGGCGITIGWIACRDKLILQQLVDVQYFGCACVSRASEIQALMVLRHSDTILQQRMTILRRNLLLLQDFIENTHSDWFDWIRPNAGAIAFVQFKGPLTSAELGEQLALRGISMKPAYCFMNQQRATDNNKYFRVGYGEEKMPLALDALRSFVDEHEAAWTEVMKKQREEV